MSRELSSKRPEVGWIKTDSFKPPFESWYRTNSFYDGRVVIREHFEWDSVIPDFMSDVAGFQAKDICHLKDTFVELNTGEIKDTHHYYFAGGDLLRKIRLDFKSQVMGYWKLARKIDPDFPSHTIADFSNLLDPFVDDQPKYFSVGMEYARISKSRLKKYPIQVDVRGGTNKGTSWSSSELFYSPNGKIEGLDCLIRRRSRNYSLRLRSCSKGTYIKQIESDFLLGERHWPSFCVSGYKQYETEMKRRGLM